MLAKTLPERISRHVVTRALGKGGFGLFDLAHDEQLRRFVAVKVPHSEVVTREEDAEPYLAEEQRRDSQNRHAENVQPALEGTRSMIRCRPSLSGS